MREIKFRGIKFPSEECIFGNGFLRHEDSSVIMATSFVEKGYITHPIRPDTLGQFTGLKDSNEVDIYEGDILKFEKGERTYLVYFKEGSFVLKNNDKIYGDWGLLSDATVNIKPHYFVHLGNISIIGNIHQNPELLTISKMKVYITKYALTEGIWEVEAEVDKSYPEMVKYKTGVHFLSAIKPYWHEDIRDAIAHAQEMKRNKIMSLEKQLDKLYKLKFSKDKVK